MGSGGAIAYLEIFLVDVGAMGMGQHPGLTCARMYAILCGGNDLDPPAGIRFHSDRVYSRFDATGAIDLAGFVERPHGAVPFYGMIKDTRGGRRFFLTESGLQHIRDDFVAWRTAPTKLPYAATLVVREAVPHNH
jgi:hypothetical protein